MKNEIKIRKTYSKLWRTSINNEENKYFEEQYKVQKRKVQDLVKKGILTEYEEKLTKDIKTSKNNKKLWENINRGNLTRLRVVVRRSEGA